MAYAKWHDEDIQGLNDNLIAAMAGGGTYPIGSTLTSVCISGTDQATLQAAINAVLSTMVLKVFSISAPCPDPTDTSTIFVILTFFNV